MYCRNRVVTFSFPKDEELVRDGYNSSRPYPLISNFKSNIMISKGLLCHLVSVIDLNHYIPYIYSVPVGNEFQDIFPNDLAGVPPP